MPLKNRTTEARVVIAIPLAGPTIYWQTVAAVLEMEKPPHSDLMVFQGALVDRARNRLIEKMLDHPMAPTHLLFLDADIVPPPDALARLLHANHPIIGALYRRRLPPYEPMAFTSDRRGNFRPISLTRLAPAKPDASAQTRGRIPILPQTPIGVTSPQNAEMLRTENLKKQKGCLREVDVTGAGCLLIRREVFEKIPGPWFTSGWTPEGHLSEDFSFCKKVRSAGYKISVDTSVRPLHLEPLGIGTAPSGAVCFVPLE